MITLSITFSSCFRICCSTGSAFSHSPILPRIPILWYINYPKGGISDTHNLLHLCNTLNDTKMKHPVFFIEEELSDKTRQWLHRQQIQYIDHPLYKIEELASRAFDGYLFFSAKGISRFKSSGNFPHPLSLIFANDHSTARAAWIHFTNKVHTSPDTEELSFVQYAIYRWMKENHYQGEHI